MSTPRTPDSVFDRDLAASRPSLILEVSSRAVFHAAIVFAIWLLAAGHNRPGGGFVGGLTIASALILTYATGGSAGLDRALPATPLTFIGIGMLLAQAAAVVPLLQGGSLLQSSAFDQYLPVFGDVHLSSVLFFDIGVLLIVMGLVAKTLDTLGGTDPAAAGDAGVASVSASPSPDNSPDDSPDTEGPSSEDLR